MASPPAPPPPAPPSSSKECPSCTSPRPHPPLLKHGEIEEVFSDVFFIKGEVIIEMPLTMHLSRNMTVVRDPDTKDLVLINSMRLSDEGLTALDKLGTVRNIVRVGAFHGRDDPFYKERYPTATVWSACPYFDKFEVDQAPHFTDFEELKESSQILPNKKSKNTLTLSIALIKTCTPIETVVCIDHPTDGKILVTGDFLQNWSSKADSFFSFTGKWMMWAMGFLKPANVGPAWYKFGNPDKNELVNALFVEGTMVGFDHVLPGHGDPCINDAANKYRSAVNSLKE